MWTMLKKLGAGEYSLKITFWMFGLLGMLFFTIATHITHSSALRMICPYGRVCAKSVVLYIISNFPILMTTSGRLSAFVPHLLTSALFICYFIILIYRKYHLYMLGVIICLITLMNSYFNKRSLYS